VSRLPGEDLDPVACGEQGIREGLAEEAGATGDDSAHGRRIQKTEDRRQKTEDRRQKTKDKNTGQEQEARRHDRRQKRVDSSGADIVLTS
jgi:hypothetical protein